MSAIDRVRTILAQQDVIAIDDVSDLGRKSLREALQAEQQKLEISEVQLLWSRLHSTACSSTGAEKHLTASCNAICVFLRCTCQSAQEEVRGFGFSQEVWFQAFEVVHRAFGDGKNKPAVQVSDTLIQILHDNHDQKASEMALRRAISDMVVCIITGQPVTRLKEACIILSCFLRHAQSIVPASEYFEAIEPQLEATIDRRCYEAGISFPSTVQPHRKLLWKFLQALLQTASIKESRTAAIKLFSLLCTKTEKIDLSGNVNTASSVIESYLNANSNALKDLSADVFPAVLNDTHQFEKFRDQFDPATEFSFPRLSIFLAILEIGRNKGFIREDELPHIVEHTLIGKTPDIGPRELDYVSFHCLLKCNVSTIRLQAYHLLTVSNATNAPVPPAVLKCLIRSFKYLHDESDSAYRDEYISISRRLVRRLQRSAYAAQRVEASNRRSDTVQEKLDYAPFLKEWSAFLCSELLPHASYQRHILALQILGLALPMVLVDTAESSSATSSDLLITTLLNLVFDPFDDVRAHATAILVTLYSHHQLLFDSILKSLHLVDRSGQLSALTNRADHADALGRLIMLEALVNDSSTLSTISLGVQAVPTRTKVRGIACSIDQYLRDIESLSPSSKFPVHGTLIALSYIVRHFTQNLLKIDEELITFLLSICDRIWRLVQGELCIDSPETEADEDDQANTGGPKDLLAYSWRALRDSSLIMQALVEAQEAHHTILQSIGLLCFEQLIRLRHRGAFSTVAQTFYLCCQNSRSSEDRRCQQLNQPLLEASFSEIYRQSNKLTRRSAGLPSLFIALLDPQNSKQFLQGIQRLAEIAHTDPYHDNNIELGLRLPQVHALNSLKDAMTNSRFRLITESLVVEMLNLAAKCLACEIWPIRNCGLMLFRACNSRLTPDSSSLYGVQATSLVGTVVQTPLAVAVSLLDQHKSAGSSSSDASAQTANIQSEAVFAALDLLNRIPYQRDHEKEIQDLVRAQFSSELWAVREQAARVGATRSCMNADPVNQNLIINWADSAPSNILQGRLLCYRYTLGILWSRLSVQERKDRIQEMLFQIQENDAMVPIARLHPIVVAAVIDLLNDAFAYTLVDSLNISELANMSTRLQDHLSKYAKFSGSPMFRRTSALNYAYIALCDLRSTFAKRITPDLDVRFSKILRTDYDATLFVIDELVANMIERYPVETAYCLEYMLQNCHSADVKAAAMMASTRCRSDLSEFPDMTQLTIQTPCIVTQYAESRDLWNSQIRHNASILREAIAQDISIDKRTLTAQISALRTSQQDDVETPTRFCAAEATAELVPAICCAATIEIEEDAKIRLLLLLFDFLNDDDEDIRETAAGAVSEIFRMQSQTQDVMVICALGARRVLRDIILTTYNKSKLLTANALIRLIGAQPQAVMAETSTITTYCETNSVGEIYSKILQKADDLFVEERQNLYIDDLEEIDVWATVARQQSLHSLGKEILQQLNIWTDQGLQYLTAQLQEESDMFRNGRIRADAIVDQNKLVVHPAGITFNVEILILIARVVTMAGLLRHCTEVDGEGSEALSAGENTFTKQLRKLQEVVKAYRIHDYVLRTLDRALEN